MLQLLQVLPVVVAQSLLPTSLMLALSFKSRLPDGVLGTGVKEHGDQIT